MTIFGDGGGRGCFIKFNFSATPSKGAILSLPSGAKIPAADASTGLVVTDVSLSQSESVAHLKCFNDTIYTFVFGANLGDVTVGFLAFLSGGKINNRGSVSNAGLTGGGSFATVLKYYADNRISKIKKLATVSMGGGEVISGQVVGMSTSTQNAETNIQSFQIFLKTTKTQEGT